MTFAQVRAAIVAKLGAEDIDPAAMADACWPEADDPNSDATHWFWRCLDQAAGDYGYRWDSETQLYRRKAS